MVLTNHECHVDHLPYFLVDLLSLSEGLTFMLAAYNVTCKAGRIACTETKFSEGDGFFFARLRLKKGKQISKQK